MNISLIKKTGLLSAAVATVLLTAGCNEEAKKSEEAKAPAEVQLDSVEKKVTYIVGYNMAKQAQANGLSFDQSVMMQAIDDATADKEPRIAQADQQKIMMEFQEAQQAKRDEERKVAADKNLEDSQAFLAENAKKEGVKTTESGLQYEVLSASTEEDAASPKEEDTVKVHYHGTLIDGTVFDSSVDRGQPATFGVNRVIKGWTEGLQLMKKGDKFKFYIPAALAYGPQGAGAKIGPNAALIFEVELLDINPEIEAHGGMSNPHQ